MFKLIKPSYESLEGNEAIRQINIELVQKEIYSLGRSLSHELDMDSMEYIDEYQEQIDELENLMDDLEYYTGPDWYTQIIGWK